MSDFENTSFFGGNSKLMQIVSKFDENLKLLNRATVLGLYALPLIWHKVNISWPVPFSIQEENMKNGDTAGWSGIKKYKL